MGLFQKEVHIVEKPKHNKSNGIKTKSLNGYDAIREKLDEHNTLTVKHQPIESVKPKTEVYWFALNY